MEENKLNAEKRLDFTKNIICDKVFDYLNNVKEFSKSDDYEKLKQQVLDSDLTFEEKRIEIDKINKSENEQSKENLDKSLKVLEIGTKITIVALTFAAGINTVKKIPLKSLGKFK